jgi:Nucleotidyltransferase domain
MTGSDPRPQPYVAAQLLWSKRYPSASVVFCGGSVVRGEGFPSSDLDVVVLFDQVANAWRESFQFEGWPVEVFGHDAQTLAYFVAHDCAGGRPSLAQMISEALVIPAETPASRAIQAWAQDVVATRPAVPTAASLAEDRYGLTDLLDDFRDDRSTAELRSIACKLYPLVCNFVLKTRGHWLGSGKTLPRLLERAAPDLSPLVESAFETFFKTGDRTGVLTVLQRVLEPFGGELFDGFRLDASASFRLTAPEVPLARSVFNLTKP